MTPQNSRFPRQRLAVFAVLGLLVGACTGSTAPIQVAIINTIDSLNPIVEALEAELVAEFGSEVEFVTISPTAASFETGIDQVLAGKPDLVVTLNTPNSLMVGQKLEGTSIPQVFGMVTDPIGSNLVSETEIPGRNRTGVGLFHIQHTLGLTVRATDAQRIGVLHQPSDAASASGLALAEEAAQVLGVELVVITVEEDIDLDRVLTRAPSLGIDLFFLIGSPFAARNLGRISLITRTWSIPTASALTVDTLPRGFMIGVAPDSADLGHQMAERAMAILHGGVAGEMPIGVAKNVALLDLAVARHYGIVVPDDALSEFDTIVGG